MKTTPSGLQYDDVVVGEGAAAQAGRRVLVHYTGWLYVDGKKGSKFDSSKDRNEPFDFNLGAGEVIRGWDEGVAGMKTGGKRTLVIPPPSVTARGARAGPFRRTPPCFLKLNCSVPNRLLNEKSPYLLQHAHNPVDWYPWGPAAFEKARGRTNPCWSPSVTPPAIGAT
jgi:FKBP-type peptidyl-prolyl cis-trans isomerase FkpA